MTYKISIFLISFFTLPITHAGYYFKNDDPYKTKFVTIYDQDDILVVEDFEIKASQALIFSCKYLKKQQINGLTIIQSDNSSDTLQQVSIDIVCPNCYYLFYNLKGELLFREDPKTAVPSFKDNLEKCLFIKRGFIQRGLFLRNIENSNPILITLQNERNRILLKQLTFASNSELYISEGEWKEIAAHDIKLYVTGNFRSNDTKKRIPLCNERFPAPIRAFDSQVIYPLTIGLQHFSYRQGMNQFNEQTKEKLEQLKPYKEYLKETLLKAPRTNAPLRLHHLLQQQFQKKSHCILKNKSDDTYEISIADQNNDPLIKSFILSPQQKIHLNSSYLSQQSVTSLNLFAHNITNGEESIKSSLKLPQRSKDNFCNKYTIFGGRIRSLNAKNFYKKISNNNTFKIRKGYAHHGYSLRNIDKFDLLITIKDDHNRPLLDSYTLPSNGEIYFPPKYIKKNKIEYLVLIFHDDDQNDIIKPLRYNFDNQTVYNLRLGLKTFSAQYLLNQNNEVSSKPIRLKKGLEKYLNEGTTFFEKRTDKPLIMKGGPIVNDSEDISGPISPSTKL